MSLTSDRRRRAKLDEAVARSFTKPILRTMRREEKRVLAATSPRAALAAVRPKEWVATLVMLWLSDPILDLWDQTQKQLGTDVAFTAETRKLLTTIATEQGKAIAVTRRKRIDRIVYPDKGLEKPEDASMASSHEKATRDRLSPTRTFRSTRRRALQELYSGVVDQAGTTAFTQALQSTETVRYESAKAAQDTATFRLVKVWFTMGDSRVRSSHQAVNGQRRIMRTSRGHRVRATFRVGGASLSHPRESGGPPGEVINCRCFLEYRRVRRKP